MRRTWAEEDISETTVTSTTVTVAAIILVQLHSELKDTLEDGLLSCYVPCVHGGRCTWLVNGGVRLFHFHPRHCLVPHDLQAYFKASSGSRAPGIPGSALLRRSWVRVWVW